MHSVKIGVHKLYVNLLVGLSSAGAEIYYLNRFGPNECGLVIEPFSQGVGALDAGFATKDKRSFVNRLADGFGKCA
jgi:hypothetical protein